MATVTVVNSTFKLAKLWVVPANFYVTVLGRSTSTISNVIVGSDIVITDVATAGLKFKETGNETATVTGDMTLTIIEGTPAGKQKVMISLKGNGTTYLPPGTYYLDTGMTLNVEATPLQGFSFLYWSVNGQKVMQNPLTDLLLDKDYVIVAYFTSPTTPLLPILGPLFLILSAAVVYGSTKLEK